MSGAASLYLALLCALAVDRWLGEPALRWHPVVWMGKYLGRTGDWVQQQTNQNPLQRDWKAFWLAALAWLLGAALVTAVAWLLQTVLSGLPWWAAAPLLGVLLKPLLAWAMLKTEVRSVEAALAQSLDAGRERLRWLVSREVSTLTATQVRESAIETLAENLNDSVVAPLFWFVLLGLPGAALYRFANTADAMWGYPGVYHGRNWAWAGKWAARVDDALSWLPARITAVCLLLAAARSGAQCIGLARQLPLEAAQTPSPNSGWPMAAMALVLNVGLCKPGVYVLNQPGGDAGPADTRQAIRVGDLALLLFVLLGCSALLALRQGLLGWSDIASLLDSARVVP
jgi:adenosylcobinamide-phosphate synthase